MSAPRSNGKGFLRPKNADPDAVRRALEGATAAAGLDPELVAAHLRTTPAPRDEVTQITDLAPGLSELAAIMSRGAPASGVVRDDVSRLHGEAVRGRRPLARERDKRQRIAAQKGAQERRRTRRDRATARRESFLASLRARAAARGDAACVTAPRDWVDAIYRTIAPVARGKDAGKRARDLCLSAGMPREDARRLRRAALDVRRDADGKLRAHRTWGNVHTRRVVVFGWALWRMRARCGAHGWSHVTAGISVGMIGSLMPSSRRDEACSRQWVSEILAELERAGFFLRRQPPAYLRAKMPAYFGPSGYAFNTYWFPATDTDEEAADDPELDAAIEAPAASKRELRAIATDPPPLDAS